MNPHALVQAAKFAALTYTPHPRTKCEYVIDTSVARVLVHVGDLTHVSFRGTVTDDCQSAAINLDGRRYSPAFLQDPFCEVHRGYAKSYERVRPRLLHVLEQLAPDAIVVGGHSSGGAVSAICALDLANALVATEVSLVTFGAPRFANAVFAGRCYESLHNVVRIKHNRDLVAEAPSLGGFQHVGAELLLTTHGLADPIRDHDMDAYRDAVLNAEKSSRVARRRAKTHAR